MKKKCFVSGSFDLLHSGHVAFFKEASEYGDLYVALGSDKTIEELKGRTPINNEQERLFVVKSNKYVKDAFISSGSGILDFEKELRELKPDIFIVNEDGNYKEKEELCQTLGIEYIISQRVPYKDLTPRSTTAIRACSNIPYRVDIAGGWLDQPFISKICPGSVITASIEPNINFNERSGMASSTRRKAIELWQEDIPIGNFEKNSKILFCYDNPPGTKEISGAQDSIGITYPGISSHYYNGEYWPEKIINILEEKYLKFLEENIYLIPLSPRKNNYNVLSKLNITLDNIKSLSEASSKCLDALMNLDIMNFGKYFMKSFESQIKIFPLMINEEISDKIDSIFSKHSKTIGCKLSGCGGGGYIVCVSEKYMYETIRIKIRRKNAGM